MNVSHVVLVSPTCYYGYHHDFSDSNETDWWQAQSVKLS